MPPPKLFRCAGHYFGQSEDPNLLDLPLDGQSFLDKINYRTAGNFRGRKFSRFKGKSV